jgi:hypothetical protein
MPVRVLGTDRDDRDARAHSLEERLRRGGPAAVVGDLEDVDAREAPRD